MAPVMIASWDSEAWWLGQRGVEVEAGWRVKRAAMAVALDMTPPHASGPAKGRGRGRDSSGGAWESGWRGLSLGEARESLAESGLGLGRKLLEV
jgi:hypothetical protein